MVLRGLLFFIFSGLLIAKRAEAKIPFLIICTVEEEEIPKNKEESVDARLMWKDAGYDGLMDCSDTKGWQAIKIKHRGHSSQYFAKKQYGFQTFDENGKKEKVSLGTFPKSAKWVLRTPYVDRSLMRDALSYNLGREAGLQRGDGYAAPRTDFVEIAINGDYKGVYILTEKIQRGPDHVPAEKLDIHNYEKLSYIAEISGESSFKTKRGTQIKLRYPSPRKLKKLEETQSQAATLIRAKIKLDIDRFEDLLLSKDFANPESGYRSHIDFASFVDFFILQEFSKNVDGFHRSEFFYKGNDGKIHMGPLWDFDLAFGNLNIYGMAKAEGWVHSRIMISIHAFWFQRLRKDPYFVKSVNKRYTELRQEGNLLSWKSLENRIDGFVAQLGEAPDRDIARWKGTYKFYQTWFMNTKKQTSSFSGNVEILKDWMKRRLIWLDRKA